VEDTAKAPPEASTDLQSWQVLCTEVMGVITRKANKS